MAAPLIYSSSPIVLNSTTLAVSDLRLPTNIARQQYQHSGNLFPSITAISGAMPRIMFKTPIKDALATIGLGLLPLTTIGVYLAKFSNATYTKLATSVHTKWAASAGCAYITGWSVGHGGICLADVEVIPFSTDGSTHPLARTDANALPTLGAEPLLHTLGPISVNGTVITGLNQLAVSMNHSVDVRVSDGDLYPRNAALIEGKPSISGEHMDPATLLTTLGLAGVNISSNVVAYWKSFDATTQLVSTANAISATIASGRIEASEIPVSQGQAAKAALLVTPLSASSTHPLVTSTSATAPAT